MNELIKYERPGLIERAKTALKALTGQIPFPQNSTYYYGSDYQNYSNSNINYATRVGDLSQSSLVMAGVRWVSNTLPEAPIQVREGSSLKGDSEVVENHKLVDLWRRPNEFYSGSTLMKGVAFSWLTKGDVYIRKVWNSSRTEPMQLWWEPHWLIKPRWKGDNQGGWIPGSGDEKNAFINYWEVDRNGTKYRLELEDVIHFQDGFDASAPSYGRCGLSGLGAILRELYGDNEAANYYARLMGGSGVPPFIASIDASVSMSKEDQIGFATELERRTSGNANEGRKFLVAKGVKVEKLGLSPKELDLRESRYMSEDRFCAVTGIPAVVLEFGSGQAHSIYNNVNQASERAIESYLVPLWRHIAEELTVQLLPDFDDTKGRYVTHDLSHVRALQEDEDSKHRRIGMDYRNGIIDRAESRSGLGYELRPEDEDVFFPNTGTKVGDIPIQPAQPLRLVKSLAEAERAVENIKRVLREVKSTPPVEIIDEAEDWWKDVAPEAARELISAKVKSNGDAEVLNG